METREERMETKRREKKEEIEVKDGFWKKDAKKKRKNILF